jgi:hypothetical protein
VLLLRVMCVTCLRCPCCTTATGLKPNCSQINKINKHMLTFLERFLFSWSSKRRSSHIKRRQTVDRSTEDKFCCHDTYSETHSDSCSTLTADSYRYAEGPVSFLASLKQNHFLPLSAYCSALKTEVAFPPKH